MEDTDNVCLGLQAHDFPRCINLNKYPVLENSIDCFIPANNSVQPECFELCGAEICDGIVSNSRFVIKIVPRAIEGSNNGGPSCLPGNLVYNSNQSLSSGSFYGSTEKEPRVLFLGFSEPWERDLWSAWLTEVSQLEINLDVI